ncbi:HNH endonuclease [Puteibacter caeruleilacunae]|nr:HNH endonuclease [Puteibacter caeruleilacunae]
MSISSKTRKILWARSGNKCAICKKELITNDNETQATVVVGEECHIISKKDDGPRGNSKAQIEHDEFDNLVLLCLEHHKVIDENVNDYSVEKLKEIKRKHEEWVADRLKKEKKESPFVLPRMESGQELAKILSRIHFYNFYNEDFENDEEATIVADYFQNLQDWGDILPDRDAGEIIKIGQQLQKELDELKENGFLLFGGVSKKNIKTLGETEVVTFSICKETSPNVIKWDEILNKMEKTDA